MKYSINHANFKRTYSSTEKTLVIKEFNDVCSEIIIWIYVIYLNIFFVSLNFSKLQISNIWI